MNHRVERPTFELDTPFGRVSARLNSDVNVVLRAGPDTDCPEGIVVNRVRYSLTLDLRAGVSGGWWSRSSGFLTRIGPGGVSSAAEDRVERELADLLTGWVEENPAALVEARRAQLAEHQARCAESVRFARERLASAEADLAEAMAALAELPAPVSSAPATRPVDESDDTF